jgi:isorenieratene synthase
VIGGGIAGLAAATALAERGIEVVLWEAGEHLGGRAAAWPVGEGRTMSRGFHAFFRQYYNLRNLLRRTDPQLERLAPVADYPLLRADGPVDSFAAIPRTPPWNLLGFVLRSPTFPLRALHQVHLPTALELIDTEYPDSFARYDGISAQQFLDRLRFPRGARHLALEVFARSFFAPPAQFAAGELVAMFHTYFTASSEGLLFDVPVDDYDTSLWHPLAEHLRDLGVQIRTGRPVTALARRDQDWIVAERTDDRTVAENPVAEHPDGRTAETRVDAVVLAADPRSTRALIAGIDTAAERAHGAAQEMHRWKARIAEQRNAPPFAVLRLWLGGPVRADRAAFLGTSGCRRLDNVSVLERFEAGAGRWSAEHGGSVVELHAYALEIPASETSAPETSALATPPGQSCEHRRAVREDLLADLRSVYPETAELPILAEELLIEDDCPLVTTSPWEHAPGVRTPLPGLVLAGDRIRCEHPIALMERAATTGFLAANALLADWGVAGHELTLPPQRGILRRGVVGRMRRSLGRPRHERRTRKPGAP